MCTCHAMHTAQTLSIAYFMLVCMASCDLFDGFQPLSNEHNTLPCWCRTMCDIGSHCQQKDSRLRHHPAAAHHPAPQRRAGLLDSLLAQGAEQYATLGVTASRRCRPMCNIGGHGQQKESRLRHHPAHLPAPQQHAGLLDFLLPQCTERCATLGPGEQYWGPRPAEGSRLLFVVCWLKILVTDLVLSCCLGR